MSTERFATQPSKTQLRRQLLQQRQTMPREIWRQKSNRLCCHLKNSVLFAQAKTVLAYFSFRQEPDLSALYTQEASSRLWGFPRCQGNDLIWHSWSPQVREALEVGAYGLLEPRSDLEIVDPADVELILVPAVACDDQGYRLGYGKGYYDRLLSQPQWQGIPTIGIIFEAGRLTALPTHHWDQPLDAVCTEVGLFLCRRTPS